MTRGGRVSLLRIHAARPTTLAAVTQNQPGRTPGSVRCRSSSNTNGVLSLVCELSARALQDGAPHGSSPTLYSLTAHPHEGGKFLSSRQACLCKARSELLTARPDRDGKISHLRLPARYRLLAPEIPFGRTSSQSKA